MEWIIPSFPIWFAPVYGKYKTYHAAMQAIVAVTLPEVWYTWVLGNSTSGQVAIPGRIFRFALERFQPIFPAVILPA